MYYLIVNPAAGNGRAKQIAQQIIGELQGRSIACQTLYTQEPGHATRLAADAAANGAEAVLSIGGDGTAFEVACGLMDTGVPMGIIPAGTGNDFIKTLKTPKDPIEALSFILARSPRVIDAGKLNDRLFLNACGTGFDVVALDYADKAKRYVKGILPYLYGVICAIFRFKPVSIRLTLDDGTVVEDEVLICAVANGRVIGGGIPIAPTARVDDHLLDVLVLKKSPRWRLPAYLPGLLMGKILSFDITTHYQCRKCELISPGMRLNVDGEIRTMDQAVFESQHDRLKLFW